jgi:hypothetical protein
MLTRRENGRSGLALAGTGNRTDHASLSAIHGQGRTGQWSAATPSNPRFYLNGANPGDAIYLTLPFPAQPSKVRRDSCDGHPVNPGREPGGGQREQR